MKYLLFLVAAFALWVGCSQEPVVPRTPVLTFENDIQPIMLNNCARAGCHAAGGESPTLLSYSDVMGQVKAGDPKGSKLFRVTTNLTPGVGMPPDGLLADPQINLIYVWILQGAKEK
jgi:hypothetical protein